MDWLSENCQIDLRKLRKQNYPYFSGVIHEEVDAPLLQLIINDETMVTEYDYHEDYNADGELVCTKNHLKTNTFI